MGVQAQRWATLQIDRTLCIKVSAYSAMKTENPTSELHTWRARTLRGIFLFLIVLKVLKHDH